MHNIDRTTLETGYGEFEADEFNYEFEGEAEGAYYGEVYAESPFNEAEEMELAAELLSIGSEAELDHFLGGLIRKAGGAIGRFVKSPVGQSLGGILKGAAKQALPMLGAAAGNLLLPGVGGMIGGKLASSAGNLLGLELEGLSQEDQEFEAARQVVRFAGAAASQAAQAAPNAPPQQAAQSAAAAAAQQYAPGLLRPPVGAGGGFGTGAGIGKLPGAATNGHAHAGRHCAHPKSGRWIRKGKTIILLGV